MTDEQKWDLQDEIQEYWEYINNCEALAEFDVQGNDVVLRNEHSFEVCLSYAEAMAYMRGIRQGLENADAFRDAES